MARHAVTSPIRRRCSASGSDAGALRAHLRDGRRRAQRARARVRRCPPQQFPDRRVHQPSDHSALHSAGGRVPSADARVSRGGRPTCTARMCASSTRTPITARIRRCVYVEVAEMVAIIGSVSTPTLLRRRRERDAKRDRAAAVAATLARQLGLTWNDSGMTCPADKPVSASTTCSRRPLPAFARPVFRRRTRRTTGQSSSI